MFVVDSAKKNVCLATLSEAKQHVLEWKDVVSAWRVRRIDWRNCIQLALTLVCDIAEIVC